MVDRQAGDAAVAAAPDEDAPSAGVTRLQIVVYSAMVAFFILAGYGFYLIYSLTKDVNGLARNVMTMTETMEVTMHSIARTMTDISERMTSIHAATETMSQSTQRMTDQMNAVAVSAQSMAVSTDNMRYDLRHLNNSVSGPIDMVTSFMPFSRMVNPPPGAAYPLPPPGGMAYAPPSAGNLPQAVSAQPLPAASTVQPATISHVVQ